MEDGRVRHVEELAEGCASVSRPQRGEGGDSLRRFAAYWRVSLNLPPGSTAQKLPRALQPRRAQTSGGGAGPTHLSSPVWESSCFQ